MRLFVALEIDPEIRTRITDYVRSLRTHAPGVRFVGPETYHVTLKFLGETESLPEIVRALTSIKFPSFEVGFRGTGFFPSAGAPRVFWAGIESHAKEPWETEATAANRSPLQRLSRQVDGALRTLGFVPEKGPFHPHLTLARAGSGSPRPRSGESTNRNMQPLAQFLASRTLPEFGTMTAREFLLYESKLSPQGAQYSVRHRFPLE